MSDTPSLEEALAFHQQGKIREARQAYQGLLQTDPENADALNLLGVLCYQTNDLSSAADCLFKAVGLNNTIPAYHTNLGNVLMALGHEADAIQCFQNATILEPDHPIAWNNLGDALLAEGLVSEAVSPLRQAVTLDETYAEAWHNLGNALGHLGDSEGGEKAHQRAMALAPENNWFKWNYALFELAEGWMEQGWQDYEIGLKLGTRETWKGKDRPRWTRQGCENTTTLIVCEQGFGDALQFIRYVPLIKKDQGKIIVMCLKPLKRLFRALPNVDQVVTAIDPLPDFDDVCPAMSLPFEFGTKLETVPSSIPYLDPGRAIREKWKTLVSDNGRKKVGLVWAGSARKHDPKAYRIDRRRSIGFDLFAGLLELKGIDFYSLQIPWPNDLPKISCDNFYEVSSHIDDFADTAGLIQQLDLIIGVDSAVIHLAGALGKPVWTLSRFDPCWRWLRNREDSPWYPTMKIYGQTEPGDWETVLERIKTDLSNF